jgi:hypothetical protein
MHIYIGSLFKHTRGNDEKLSMRKGFIYLPKKVNSLSSPGGSSVAIVMLRRIPQADRWVHVGKQWL